MKSLSTQPRSRKVTALAGRTPAASRRVTAHFGQVAELRYRTAILDPARGLIQGQPFKRNLLLDVGLDFIAAKSWRTCVEFARVGTGNTATQTDSGTTTLARVGTTVTASAGFFVSGMVGQLIRWDTGEQAYIASFTDGTHVETVDGGAIAGSEATVWAVNQTNLDVVSKNSSATTGLGPNSLGWSSGLGAWVIERTFLFTAEVGAVTYREVGWAPLATGNAFGRDVLSGGGDSLVAGQQYVITLNLAVYPSPITVTAVGSVGTGGIDTSGNAVIETVLPSRASEGGAFSWNGWGNDGSVLEACSAGVNCIIAGADATWTQTVADNSTSINGIGPFNTGVAATLSGYTAGSFTITKSALFSVAQLNGSIFGLGIVSTPDGAATRAKGFTVKFTAAQTKLATQTLTVAFRWTWQRKFS